MACMNVDTAPASLRERKKLATRRALQRVALDLVAERGFAHVTVEDIAEAADVSPRTFFNYFPSKEAALFDVAAEQREDMRRRILDEAPGESAVTALRRVLTADAVGRAERIRELAGDPADWLRRMKSLRDDPQLRAAQAAQQASTEREIAEALAERLGADLTADPYPLLLAAAATAVTRASMAFWAGSGGTVRLDQITSLAWEALASGLPEDCRLRNARDGSVRDGKDD
jgi:AcrR family transcriptional regulator